MTVSSRAKINLGLKVLGRRPDGFHDIQSVFLEVDLADRMILSVSDDGSLSVTAGGDVPDGRDNLVWQAAEALRRRVGRTDLGATVRIRKHIPAGGGLGGGSSNAAAALKALSTLWGLALQPADLDDLAASLGSDVPFFLTGGCARVTGRGERVEPLTGRDRIHFVLVDPGFRVSTPWAFRTLADRRARSMELTCETPYTKFLNSVCDSGEVSLLELLPLVENDFLPVVADRFPSVERILSVIADSGALCASLSGTGATLFGGFAEEALADRTAERLQNQGYRAFSCQPVRSSTP